MIVYGALVLVILVTLVFYLIDRTRILWWEFFVPIGITLGLIFGIKSMINYSAVQFTEYWGETMTYVVEEEPYNYWHHQTCSRSVPCGTDKDGNTQYCTEYYDCSHQEDVGPHWWCKTNLDNDYRLTEHQHDSIVALFGTGKRITDTRENYDSDDRAVGSKGTKFEGTTVGETSNVLTTTWNGSDPTRKGVFTEHSYENRIKASDLTLFNIMVVKESEADSLGLYKYPEIKDNINYPTILGKNIPRKVQEDFKKLNAKFGPSNKLRLWVLVFDNKPVSIAPLQENYWVKGNKNELVICIGRKGEEIQWAYSFSWSLSADLTAEVTQKVLNLYSIIYVTNKNKKFPMAIPLVGQLKKTVSDYTGIDTNLLAGIPVEVVYGLLPKGITGKDVAMVMKSKTPVLTEQTWEAYYDYLNSNLNKFQKRSFEEFSYLKVEPKKWQIIMIYIIALIVAVGINLWTFSNEFEDD
jgi:hypothetical protein